jgi:hypothetical protein
MLQKAIRVSFARNEDRPPQNAERAPKRRRGKVSKSFSESNGTFGKHKVTGGARQEASNLSQGGGTSQRIDASDC